MPNRFKNPRKVLTPEEELTQEITLYDEGFYANKFKPQLEKPLIEIKNLSVNFQRASKLFEAVKNVNLTIKKGEILGIVGESGSGKTTLGRSILGLWPHAKGGVFIDGRLVPQNKISSVSSKNIWVYKRGQMIFQDPTSSLNQKQKVYSIVSEGLFNFGTLKEEINNKIKKINEELILLEKEESYLKNPYLRIEDNFQQQLKDKYEDFIKQEAILNEEYNDLMELAAYRKSFFDEREKLLNEQQEIVRETKKSIKFLKQKTRSDKVLAKENSQSDKDFIKNAYEEDKREFAKMKEKFAKNPERVNGRVQKRIDTSYKNLLKPLRKVKVFSVFSILKIESFPQKIDSKTLQDYISNLEIWIDDNRERYQKEPDFFVLCNLLLDLKLLQLKQKEVLSVLNTRGFDFIYKYINEKVANRINSTLEKINDLDRIHHQFEKKKNDASLSQETAYYTHMLRYLAKYRNYMINQIEEYRFLRIEFKQKATEHNEDNIKELYDFLRTENKKYDLIYLSLLTWKNEQQQHLLSLKEKFLIAKNEAQLNFLNQSLERLDDSNPGLQNLDEEVKRIFATKFAALKKELITLRDVEVKKLKATRALPDQKKLQNLYGEMKAYEEEKEKLLKSLKSPKQLKEAAYEKVTDVLKTVGLNAEDINKFPGQFSGGQKQRIGIARTIITNPDFIVADEPISALDVSVQAQVINLLKDLQSQYNLTLIFIAHDLAMVNYISHKIAVIYRGNIVEYGKANRIYNNPIHPYTKSLIAAMPSIKEVGKKLEVSEYSWADHSYNEFSDVKMHQVDEEHFVFGTAKEIKAWTKEK